MSVFQCVFIKSVMDIRTIRLSLDACSRLNSVFYFTLVLIELNRSINNQINIKRSYIFFLPFSKIHLLHFMATVPFRTSSINVIRNIIKQLHISVMSLVTKSEADILQVRIAQSSATVT